MNRRSGLAAFLATLASMLALGQTPADQVLNIREPGESRWEKKP